MEMKTGILALAAMLAALPGMSANAQSITMKDWTNCTQMGDLDLSIRFCTKIANSRLMNKRNQAIALSNRGNAWVEKSEYDKAISDFNASIALVTSLPHPYTGRGNAYRQKGEWDIAVSDYNEALKLDPGYVPSLLGRAACWVEKRNFDQAQADYNEAIRRNTTASPIPYNNRALLWRDLGELDRALADDNEAIRLGAKWPSPYSNRGEIWRLKGDLDKALADQNEAIRLNSRNVIAFELRGDTYRYKGEFERALADYDAALRINNDAIPALTGRGLTYEKMGDPVSARAEFQKAVESTSPNRYDIHRSALETARSRLAAMDSGALQPTIPAAPSKTASATSIPTPTARIPVVAPSSVAAGGRRIALVVGNSKYKSVPSLLNPPRDAEAIAGTLRTVGFQSVVLLHDATREMLIEALRTFAAEAEKADWAVVYYAGHGMEMNGVNYLIPVDAILATDRDVQLEAIPLDQILIGVEGAKKLKLILLDACRDNPFAPNMRRTAATDAVAARSTAGAVVATRSIGRGLGEVKVSGATLVVYAAKNGQTALDGDGDNSPFAVAVTQRVATPGVEINKIFRLVRDDVMEATAGRQEPYTYGSLPGKEDFFFVAK
jgi:tetratricopeptide (TPR) repeat protein